jgi:hypothetical protein
MKTRCNYFNAIEQHVTQCFLFLHFSVGKKQNSHSGRYSIFLKQPHHLPPTPPLFFGMVIPNLLVIPDKSKIRAGLSLNKGLSHELYMNQAHARLFLSWGIIMVKPATSGFTLHKDP